MRIRVILAVLSLCLGMSAANAEDQTTGWHDASELCRKVIERANPADPQLIRDQDWSGRDLSGQDFHSKTFLNVRLRAANLTKTNFDSAVFCGSDLSNSVLKGADLDASVIAGGSSLEHADLTGASGRGLVIADADYDGARIDAAQLQDAVIACRGGQVECGQAATWRFAGIAHADLRGAEMQNLLSSAAIETTLLDGAVLDLDPAFHAFQSVATAIGPQGKITFRPTDGSKGKEMVFDAAELTELDRIVNQSGETAKKDQKLFAKYLAARGMDN